MKKTSIYALVFVLGLMNISCGASASYKEFEGDQESLLAIGALFTLYAACDSFRDFTGHYPASLATLGQSDPPWISPNMGSGWVGSSVIDYKQLGKDGYEILITTGGGYGGRRFYMDQTGFMRFDNAKGKIIDRSPIAEKKERNRLVIFVGIPALLLIGLYYFRRR